MPKIKLKINRRLCRGLDGKSTAFEEIPIQVPEDEAILEMVRRFAAENGVFRKAIFDEKAQEVQANILVILNGRIINPYDRSQTTLKEGDEIMFLPMMDGG